MLTDRWCWQLAAGRRLLTQVESSLESFDGFCASNRAISGQGQIPLDPGDDGVTMDDPCDIVGNTKPPSPP